MMENSIGDSLSVIEPCLDLPGALKLHFVDGGFSDGITNRMKWKEVIGTCGKSKSLY